MKRSLSWETLVRCMTTFRRVPSKDRAPLWSPGVPRGDHREKEATEAVSCVVCDIDKNADFREVARSAFMEFLHLWHSSWNHTEENPRGRIVVPLAVPVPARHWRRAWWLVNKMCGGTMDPATKDPCRVYYLPATDGRIPTCSYYSDDSLPMLDLRPFDELPPTPEEVEEERRRREAERNPLPPLSCEERRNAERRFVHKTLQICCEEIATAEKGTRNGIIAKQAFKMGGYVAGGYIEAERARTFLLSACAAAGYEPGRAIDVVDRQMAAGARKPVRLNLR